VAGFRQCYSRQGKSLKQRQTEKSPRGLIFDVENGTVHREDRKSNNVNGAVLIVVWRHQVEILISNTSEL